MATGLSDNRATYEDTRISQTPQPIDLLIKQEVPDHNCSGVSDYEAEGQKDSTLHVTNSGSHVDGEKPEEKSVFECLFPKNEPTESESIGFVKTECLASFEGTEVKQELEDTSSTPPQANLDRSYEEEKYKIDIDDHKLLRDDRQQDKDGKNGIDRFSLADTEQTCGKDDWKQRAWKTELSCPETDNHIKHEMCDHASSENAALKSSLYKEALCGLKSEDGEMDGSTKEHHNRKDGRCSHDQQTGESDQHNENDGLHAANKSYLRGHITRMHGRDTEVYRCASCNYNTKCPSNFSHHQMSKHKVDVDVYKCEECTFTTRSRCYLYTYARVKHNPDAKVYKCSECQFTTKYKTHLTTHVKVKHTPNTDTYRCTECESTTTDKSCRHAEAKRNPAAETFRCSECTFTTKYKKHLKRHVRVKHDPNAEVFKCSECDYTTKYTTKLSIHVRVRHDPNVEVYKCSECDFTTKYRSTLSEHANVRHNSGAEVYRCSRCSFTTRARKFLFQHARLKHDPNARVYECSECTYTTKHKTRLCEHVNAKHNPHPELYRCGECVFTTKHRTALCEHVKVRHDARAELFRCSECNFVTRWKRSLTGHRKTQHCAVDDHPEHNV